MHRIFSRLFSFPKHRPPLLNQIHYNFVRKLSANSKPSTAVANNSLIVSTNQQQMRNTDHFQSQSLKEAYLQSDRQKCRQFLSIQQQSLINQMVQGPLNEISIDWLYFQSLKTNIHFKFRQYPQMHNSIANQFQILIKLNLLSSNLPITCNLTNKYLLVLLLGDRVRAKKLLKMNESKHRRKVQPNQKETWQTVMDFYREIFKNKPPIQSGKKGMIFQSQYIYQTSTAVIQSAIHALPSLIGLAQSSKFQPYENLLASVAALTIIAYNSVATKHQKPANNSHLIELFRDKVLLQTDKLTSQQIDKLSYLIVSPSQVEDLINAVLQCKWQSADSSQVNLFFRLLFMVAQNYHIIKAYDQSYRVIQALKDHVRQVKVNASVETSAYNQAITLQILLQYLQLSILFDKKMYGDCIAVYNTFQQSLKEYLHDLATVELDIIRCYIYKIISNCYQHLNKLKECDEYEITREAYEAAYQVWTFLKVESSGDPQIDEFIGTNLDKPSGMIVPHYYFHLPFAQMFTIDWNQFQQVQDNQTGN